MLSPLKLSHSVAGAVAVLLGYTGSVVIIAQASGAPGANLAQADSWILVLVMGIGVGMGLNSLGLSLMSRMPILTARFATPPRQSLRKPAETTR
ncbi:MULTISPECIES: benzoate/H(+) symporter BenE family transporter [unclassified Phaeobacter]|uniref:benzoate/H(+) symporter BenE family transporter n=1 Tax=unclassified Phaeobacter TaxID=2621772 RepID=UPI003A863699